MRPAQVASMRLVPGVEAVLPNELIPAPTPTFVPLHQLARAPQGPRGRTAHLAAGVCGTASHPQLDPEALTNIDAEAAIESGADGAGVTVGFIADGIATSNPDLRRSGKFKSPGNPAGRRVITSYKDFGGDGTAARTAGGEAFLDASSIAAQGNTTYDLSKYVSGVHPLHARCDMVIQGDAPGATLTAIKAFSNTFTTSADLVGAINYAITSGDKVLNESFGSNPFPDGSLDAIKLADNAAVDAGVTVVVSSGDAGVANTIGTPADDPLVIAVGATTTLRSYQQFSYGGINVPGVGNGKVIDDNVSSISSSGFAFDGKTIDLVAPGDSNWALCSRSSYYRDCAGSNLEFTGGTSESAPLTSGAAADVIQAYAATHHGEDPTPALVKHILTSSAQDVGAPGIEQGAGLLDVGAAVNLARSIKGTTQANPAGGLLADSSQLNLAGGPRKRSSATISLTNTGTSSVTLTPYVRSLTRTGQTTGSVTMDPSDATPQPKFSNWSGVDEVYQKATFRVPSRTSHLVVDAGYQDVNQNSFLHVALFDPSGTYAGYSLPQGLGDYANIGVADPAPGRWTAVFFTAWDGGGKGVTGTSGAVPWVASFWRFHRTAKVSHRTLTINPGKTRYLKVTLRNPSSPGDTGYSLVLGDGMTVPVTLRTSVPVGTGGFRGVLTGGNGRGGAEAQSDLFAFTVPRGMNDLDASIAMRSNPPDTELKGDELVGELIDPSGQLQAYDTNYTESSRGATVTPYLNLYKSRPGTGKWQLLVYWANPVTGGAVAVPYAGAVEFNVVSESSNLPDSPTTDVPTSGGSFSVNVHNTGVAPLLLTPDARLTSDATYPLADIFGGKATQKLPGLADNTYFIPNETSSVTVDQASTVRASFDFSPYPGDPDLSPLNGNALWVTASQSSSTAQLTYSPRTMVTPGLWSAADSEVGPFRSGAAPPGTETTSVSIDTAVFDPAVSSPDGDAVRSLTTGTHPPNGVELDPGASVSIPIVIDPTAAVGTTAFGTLYLVGLSGPDILEPSLGPEDLFTNELAAIPYAYTVSG
jgi:hypothetical protein